MSVNVREANDTSTKARRRRTGNLPIVVNMTGKHELHFAWKFSDSAVGLFSDSPPHSKDRVPFGSIIDVRFDERTKDGNTSAYLCCSSIRSNKKYMAFKISDMLISMQVNSYTLDMQKLRLDKKERLLAQFLQLLIHAEGFSQHDPKVHLNDGRMRNGEEVQEKDIIEAGGSLVELHKFIETAKSCAIQIGALGEVPGQLAGKPRSLSSVSQERVVKGNFNLDEIKPS